MGHNKCSAQRKVHRTLSIPKNLERLHTSNLTAHLQSEGKKTEASTLQRSRWHEIVNIEYKESTKPRTAKSNQL